MAHQEGPMHVRNHKALPMHVRNHKTHQEGVCGISEVLYSYQTNNTPLSGELHTPFDVQ